VEVNVAAGAAGAWDWTRTPECGLPGSKA
jgi:hypothetical protein